MCIEVVRIDIGSMIAYSERARRLCYCSLIRLLHRFRHGKSDHSDEFVTEAGIDANVGAYIIIVQPIFSAATGIVRIRQPHGSMALSASFNIARGFLHGDWR